MAYRLFKIRVREILSIGHSGPESLEDAVLDYIVRHEDLYDVQASVNVSQGQWGSNVFDLIQQLINSECVN